MTHSRKDNSLSKRFPGAIFKTKIVKSMDGTIADVFHKEVYRWRTGAAIIWSVITVPVVFGVYVMLAYVDVLHPSQWISGSLSTLFSVFFVLICFVLLALTGLWCCLCLPTFTVEPEVSGTPLLLAISMCSPQKLGFGLVCFLVSGLSSLLCTGILMGRYQDLTVCTNRDFCVLNEHHLFLVLYGCYTGVIFYLFHFLKQNNYLQFNTIQQSKYFQVRSQILPLLQTSFHCVLQQTIYFYPLYWLFGHIPTGWIVHSLGLRRSALPLDSIYGLLDMGLLWQTVLCGLLVHVSWSLGSLLIKVYITERYCFPIESMLNEKKNQCLIDALQCDQNIIVKYLGYLDLCLLSKHSPERRQITFSLSQPGGHPHNWTKLSTSCLSVITALSEKIQDANWQVFSQASIRSEDIRKPPGNQHGSTLTYRGDNVTKETAPPQPIREASSFWRTKPIISYFLTEFPDAKSRKLFASAQLDIWAVEALCHLVATSYTEDKYGVVQKSLPQILTAVINLQENVEKHMKLASSGRRISGRGALDLPLKYVLHSSLKSCIYRIINVFGVHLLNLDLPSDTSYKLKLFMDFKE
ncbi:nucleoporin NDC1-like [Saccostrea echinata]|uniref:nucleoporin NDC1-like n=1 Tax=Saccostrea echinata TaxID=191078 RepID=UPI002A82EC31|nr:nucleoporin NDC1-like [Saccostrea echinata]